ncbi:glutamine--tRNA ligase/YqeY domain fusion protein [Herbaspirillum sp. YR522]|uniref:glutamine--tRNA ligase/YqeY domain fusion protein n=1 Tax=Herbaspirillum sp. YR522 TaxID=1144342 RepID=UPI00026F7F1D|nr:glutamine--tRNA ligase/YqeY domain fusion protein [Herbaspirillum sp. YR522]EJN10062.1 glutaminyl-tRNA synthetase [Herbaspirillum sp. YR522]
MSNDLKNGHAGAPANGQAPVPPTNFLRGIIEADLAGGTYAGRTTQDGVPLPQVITRFPPEPNGYLHIGHAKSICLNFGLARDYAGRCHMRFDDTNPEKEEQEYVDTILDAVQWLGFSWEHEGNQHLYYASNYFDFMYAGAQALIRSGHAYVDEQNAEQMRETRGTLTEPGRNSPWRDRPADESLRLFEEMRDGKHPDGSLILRARIDMASPNMNLRDPAIYRIRHAVHHNTGSKWCVYPMYSYAHPVEDALENISHSICTLEFEDQRPLYDWVLERLSAEGMFSRPLPRQYEFARLNLTYIITSKRKLKQLVDEKIVEGWDDPRMPTIVGLRRRGYTPEAIRLMCDRTGASKHNSWIDYGVLEGALREDLDPKARRAVAVLRPLKLIIDNFPAGQSIDCSAPVYPPAHPLHDQQHRHFPITRELWIEREDFMEVPPKGYFRLFPGNKVRLRYGYVVECTGFDKDQDGNVIAVHCNYFEDSKSGTEGSSNYKVKGNLHWVSAEHALATEVRLYDRLFTDPHPDAGGKDFLTALNANSKDVITAYLEPTLKSAQPGDIYQFERHGYFVADRIDSTDGQPVFNRAVTLKDSWGK